MAINVTCPHCAHQMKVPDHFGGRDGRCPNCKTVFRAIPTVPTRVPSSSSSNAAIPVPSAAAPAAQAVNKPAPRVPAPRSAAADHLPPTPQPRANHQQVEDFIPAVGGTTSTTNRVYQRSKKKRKEVPVWVWVIMVAGGVGSLLLVLGLMVLLTGGGGGASTPGGGGSGGFGGGSLLGGGPADPDAGFDSSRVSVPAPHPIATASDYIIPPAHLDDAVGVCQSFRFIPANQQQYAWMQVLARYLASFEWELEQVPFRGTPQRKAELQVVVQRTLQALDQVKFTQRRIEAVNKQASVAFDSQEDNWSVPLFAFGTVFRDSSSNTQVLTIDDWLWSFGIRKATNFTRAYSGDCRYMFVGFVLTNDIMEVREESGHEDIVLLFRTYHIWAEEGSGAIAIPDT